MRGLPGGSADFQVFGLNYCLFWSDADFIISRVSQETSMLFILYPPFKNITVKNSFHFFQLSFVVAVVVTNSMQHFLEAIPSPSLIFLTASYFLTFKIISQLLILNNSCDHRRGSFRVLLVQVSAGVDPGSHINARVGEPSVSGGGAAKARLTDGNDPVGLFVFCKERRVVANPPSWCRGEPPHGVEVERR